MSRGSEDTPLTRPQVPSEEDDWRRYQLLLGKPGTGKSPVLKRLICSALESRENVALCAPLAILVSSYRDQFPDDLYADTVHAMFNIPVNPEDPHLVNCKLGHYDLLLVEETSMISQNNFGMLNSTLNKQVRRPLVIVAGDEKQQHPLETVGTKTVQGKSILSSIGLKQSSQSHSLYQQFRCRDRRYQEFLDLLRYVPNATVLKDFTARNTIYDTIDIGDGDIWRAKVERPRYTVLTVSRKAAAQ